jgi:tetratricopeptide (TPR) repeat protein
MIHFLLLAWLAGQSATSEALQHIQAGLDARKQHQIDAEITEFRKASELDPSLADAFVNLGAAYMEKHDYGAAIGPLKRALELSPDLPAAHQFLGYALLSQGYAAEAIPHLERVGARDALGIAQIQTGQLMEALGNFNEALAKRPNDPDLLYYLGRSGGLLSKGAIDTLIAAYPDSARAHQALAENYFVLRQMPHAEKEFQEALRLRPELPGLHLELGQVYANSAQWLKAEDEFRAEAKLQPGNAEAAYRLGSALLQEGKFHEARQELERADVLKPNMPETLYSLGKAASLDGDAMLAERSWNKLLEIERDTSLSAQAHFALATLYRKQGNAVKAQREMQEYQKLQSKVAQPQNPPH